MDNHRVLMVRFFNYLRNHKFESYSIAFLLMMIPPIPMYYAAQGNQTALIYLLLGFVILGNLLVLIVK